MKVVNKTSHFKEKKKILNELRNITKPKILLQNNTKEANQGENQFSE